ncbi:hypothetical protein Hanom_Chr09g00810621 [Helianthus anomalus]
MARPSNNNPFESLKQILDFSLSLDVQAKKKKVIHAVFKCTKKNTLWWMLRKYLMCQYNKLGIIPFSCLDFG